MSIIYNCFASITKSLGNNTLACEPGPFSFYCILVVFRIVWREIIREIYRSKGQQFSFGA